MERKDLEGFWKFERVHEGSTRHVRFDNKAFHEVVGGTRVLVIVKCTSLACANNVVQIEEGESEDLFKRPTLFLAVRNKAFWSHGCCS